VAALLTLADELPQRGDELGAQKDAARSMRLISTRILPGAAVGMTALCGFQKRWSSQSSSSVI
jgi:hypothetical protein